MPLLIGRKVACVTSAVLLMVMLVGGANGQGRTPVEEAGRLGISLGEYDRRLSELVQSGRLRQCELETQSQLDLLTCLMEARDAYGLLVPERVRAPDAPPAPQRKDCPFGDYEINDPLGLYPGCNVKR